MNEQINNINVVTKYKIEAIHQNFNGQRFEMYSTLHYRTTL